MVREYLDSLIVAGLVALLLISFVIRTYYIPSISMVPTLDVRDVVLVDQLTYRFGGPQPEDVAVFTPPVPAEGSAFIKRVIGVPGDTIRISDGIVYRNGTALVEPYANQPAKYDLEIKRYGIYVDGRPLDPSAADVPAKASVASPGPHSERLLLHARRQPELLRRLARVGFCPGEWKLCRWAAR